MQLLFHLKMLKNQLIYPFDNFVLLFKDVFSESVLLLSLKKNEKGR
ncbi:MAG TPA: hypothetical protein K8W13_03500 [Enterococcus columbae]|nr:hypothetical protein [Enterococcus columbae]